jgi:hypothetical protein
MAEMAFLAEMATNHQKSPESSQFITIYLSSSNLKLQTSDLKLCERFPSSRNPPSTQAKSVPPPG